MAFIYYLTAPQTKQRAQTSEQFNQFIPIEVESNDPIVDNSPVGSYLITTSEQAFGAPFSRDPMEMVRAKLATLYKLDPAKLTTTTPEVAPYEASPEFVDFDNTMPYLEDTYVLNQRYSNKEVKIYPIHAQYYE